MKGKLIMLALLTSTQTACYMVAGTPSGIREWERGRNGNATIAKAKNGEEIKRGYWENQTLEDSLRLFWKPSEEQGS